MKTPRLLEKHREIDVPVRVYEHPGVTIQGFSRAAFLSYVSVIPSRLENFI